MDEFRIDSGVTMDRLINFYREFDNDIKKMEYACFPSASFNNPYSNEKSFLSQFSSEFNVKFFFIVQGTKDIGFIVQGKYPEIIRDSVVIFLIPSLRGKGLVKQLLDEFCSSLSLRNVGAIYAITRMDWQRRYVESLGFRHLPSNSIGSEWKKHVLIL